MLTPNYDAFEPGDKVGRTFVWNEPDSPGEVSNSSSNASSYLFTRSALRTPIKASKRPSTPLPASNLTPRDITPRFLTGQILPGGRGPASRRGSNRSENSLFQPRRFVFEDIDETAQEEEPTGLFSPGEVDENRNSLGFTPSSSNTDTPSLSSSMLGLGLRQKTKTFILDDDSVQISEDGTSKRSQSVESIHLNDPRSPLLTSREAQKLCLGKSAKHKHGVGAVKGMLLCHCNCSRLRRSRNRVGCLPDPYEEL